jgi:hypothetical protein
MSGRLNKWKQNAQIVRTPTGPNPLAREILAECEK